MQLDILFVGGAGREAARDSTDKANTRVFIAGVCLVFRGCLLCTASSQTQLVLIPVISVMG